MVVRPYTLPHEISAYIYIYRLMPVTTFIFSCETDLLVFSQTLQVIAHTYKYFDKKNCQLYSNGKSNITSQRSVKKSTLSKACFANKYVDLFSCPLT